MISTRDLRMLPEVTRLRSVFQAMAMLDAIIMPEWEFRYYSFESAEISPDRKISIGSMRNGSGDDLHAIFGSAGCVFRGFAHEHEMSPYANRPPKVYPGILDDLPADFNDCRAALHEDWWRDITFCVWRRYSDSKWHHGNIDFPDLPDPDGSQHLMAIFDGKPETYLNWAEEYYEPREFSLTTIRWVYEQRPLTEEIIKELNPEQSLANLVDEITQIGYGRDTTQID